MTGHRRLEGKVAIITGAASGIGRAAAFLFANEGARLTLADISEAALTGIVDQISKDGGQAIMKKTDVSNEEEVKALIDLTLDTYSQVDILCNNAGIAGGSPSLEEEDGEAWRKVMEVNVMGAVFATKHIASHMKERKSGSIVNTSSVAGIRAGAGTNAYSASKAAIISFTQTAACDLGGFNVRVNAVCPGLIETGMTKPVFDFAREAGKESKLGYRCEMRRYGRPEEVAAAILFLASDEASYITGQALPVDGGNTASLNLPGMKY
ncbi:MAG: SDR family oxidoreductase [Deltaproteobacteria bacterium]|nr:SDR family oxidoreductase [Deltaproteobacteria bacterium]MBW2051759.1 SDR family oxidoreductase [Deltaproteobacteria bacterium]MBW2140385.1 SDR family oxidoreductase [Deltaproteobacteria bacterium]MBW2322371.1 SDR family oxidoreductase [Deltaproteobacteria bacterium]